MSSPLPPSRYPHQFSALNFPHISHMPSPYPSFQSPLPICTPSHGFPPIISPRRPRSPIHWTAVHFLEPVIALPEFINHLIVSCGIGMAGIAGAKATEGTRALKAGDIKAEKLEQAALEIDSLRRRRELKQVKGEVREWGDVGVDRFGGVPVWVENVPEIPAGEELKQFDRLLEGGEDK